jgi:hypothetical protein
MSDKANFRQLLLILLIIMSAFTNRIYSQYEEPVMNKKEIKALEKEKRQAEKKEQEEYEKKLVEYMIDNKKFVLEADYLSGSSGSRIPVNSTLNFIVIDSNKVIIQLANSWGAGYNGLGGITLDGSITKYDIHKQEGKRGVSYSLTVFIMSSLGTYDIQFWISQNGYADASISGNTSGRLNYSGKIVPLKMSRTFKGQSYP